MDLCSTGVSLREREVMAQGTKIILELLKTEPMPQNAIKDSMDAELQNRRRGKMQ